MSDAESALLLGVKMRAIQTRYFKDRMPIDLRLAKKLENEFDSACKAVLGKDAVDAAQGELFGN